MTIAYIVTAGSYSEYRICSVWDNAEDAEREAAKYGTGYDSALVQEYILNSTASPHPPLWKAKLSENGDIKVDDRAFPAVEAGDIRSEVWPKRNGGLTGYAYGVSPDIARKSLQDAMAKHKAQRDKL